MTLQTPIDTDEPPDGLVRAYRMSAPNVPETAKVARDMIAALLQVTGLPGLVDTARLLVSEVVANVHLHTKVPQLTLDATVRNSAVLVSVLDTDPRGVPQIRQAITGAEHGRGLPLVQHFATAWGTTWSGDLEPTGKSVWFELRNQQNEDEGAPTYVTPAPLCGSRSRMTKS